MRIKRDRNRWQRVKVHALVPQRRREPRCQLRWCHHRRLGVSVSVLLLPGDGVVHRYPMDLYMYSVFTLCSHTLDLYACIYMYPYVGNITYANLNFNACTIVTARCILLAPLCGAYELLVVSLAHLAGIMYTQGHFNQDCYYMYIVRVRHIIA